MPSRDNSLIPASVLQSGKIDPAAGTSAPANYGQAVVPHIMTASGRIGVASHAYLNMDEATRNSRVNAERMRTDCGIMECVEQRQRAVALLPWHIEPEDDRNASHKELAAEMTAILEETPRFTEFRRCLQESIWYGRYAIAEQFGVERIGGKTRYCVRRWEPRHGDKLVFRFDDGDHTTLEDQVGIRVSTSFRSPRQKRTPFGSMKSQIEPTEMGLVYWFNAWERKTVVVHKHMIEDGTFEDPRSAGRIHGIGIRDRIYWAWYAMVECLQRVVEYLDRAAFGVEVWPYLSGSAESKRRTEEAAYQTLSGGRSIILAPIQPGDNAELFFPRLMEPGLAGVNTTIDVIQNFFFHRIKRYVLGQILSSEAEATGLGSGVAEAHLATFADIISYDARNLEETITRELLRPLQAWNFKGSEDVRLRFKINTESDNVRERLESLEKAWGMGLALKTDEVYRIAGTAKPDMEDEVLRNPQFAAQAMDGAVVGGANGGQLFSPESFAQSFEQQLAARGLVHAPTTEGVISG